MNSKKIKILLKNKKFLIVFVLICLVVSYFVFKLFFSDKPVVSYTTVKIEKGTLISNVSSSGQVVSLDQTDVKSKTSGTIVYKNLKNGTKVNKGDLLLQLDTSEAQKDVWNAEIALKNATLSSKDLAKESNDNLATVQNNILNTLSTNYKDLATYFPNIDSMFTTSSYSSSDNNDVDYYLRLVRFVNNNSNNSIDLSYWDITAEEKYLDIKSKYENIQTNAWFLNNNSSKEKIENALNQAYDNNKELLDFTRQTLSLIQKYQYIVATNNIIAPIPSTTTTSQIGYLTSLNSVLVTNTNSLNTLKTTLNTANDTDNKLAVNLETQDLTIRQKELELASFKNDLNDHFIYAPFSGVLTAINESLKINDEISSNTSLATIVTNEQIAEITLNEIDVAKVKIDQKANITFDALSDLNITGTVIEVDDIGTNDQGVVSYGVKISFDNQDERVKPGMSLSANIITDIKTDTYIINSSAVKEDDNGYYIEILNDDNSISQKVVTIGISSDTQTEILSGVDENDNIILKTSNSTSRNTTNSNNNNGFNIPGMGGGGGMPMP